MTRRIEEKNMVLMFLNIDIGIKPLTRTLSAPTIHGLDVVVTTTMVLMRAPSTSTTTMVMPTTTVFVLRWWSRLQYIRLMSSVFNI